MDENKTYEEQEVLGLRSIFDIDVSGALASLAKLQAATHNVSSAEKRAFTKMVSDANNAIAAMEGVAVTAQDSTDALERQSAKVLTVADTYATFAKGIAGTVRQLRHVSAEAAIIDAALDFSFLDMQKKTVPTINTLAKSLATLQKFKLPKLDIEAASKSDVSNVTRTFSRISSVIDKLSTNYKHLSSIIDEAELQGVDFSNSQAVALKQLAKAAEKTTTTVKNTSASTRAAAQNQSKDIISDIRSIIQDVQEDLGNGIRTMDIGAAAISTKFKALSKDIATANVRSVYEAFTQHSLSQVTNQLSQVFNEMPFSTVAAAGAAYVKTLTKIHGETTRTINTTKASEVAIDGMRQKLRLIDVGIERTVTLLQDSFLKAAVAVPQEAAAGFAVLENIVNTTQRQFQYFTKTGVAAARFNGYKIYAQDTFDALTFLSSTVKRVRESGAFSMFDASNATVADGKAYKKMLQDTLVVDAEVVNMLHAKVALQQRFGQLQLAMASKGVPTIATEELGLRVKEISDIAARFARSAVFSAPAPVFSGLIDANVVLESTSKNVNNLIGLVNRLYHTIAQSPDNANGMLGALLLEAEPRTDLKPVQLESSKAARKGKSSGGAQYGYQQVEVVPSQRQIINKFIANVIDSIRNYNSTVEYNFDDKAWFKQNPFYGSIKGKFDKTAGGAGGEATRKTSSLSKEWNEYTALRAAVEASTNVQSALNSNMRALASSLTGQYDTIDASNADPWSREFSKETEALITALKQSFSTPLPDSSGYGKELRVAAEPMTRAAAALELIVKALGTDLTGEAKKEQSADIKGLESKIAKLQRNKDRIGADGSPARLANIEKRIHELKGVLAKVAAPRSVSETVDINIKELNKAFATEANPTGKSGYDYRKGQPVEPYLMSKGSPLIEALLESTTGVKKGASIKETPDEQLAMYNSTKDLLGSLAFTTKQELLELISLTHKAFQMERGEVAGVVSDAAAIMREDIMSYMLNIVKRSIPDTGVKGHTWQPIKAELQSASGWQAAEADIRHKFKEGVSGSKDNPLIDRTKIMQWLSDLQTGIKTGMTEALDAKLSIGKDLNSMPDEEARAWVSLAPHINQLIQTLQASVNADRDSNFSKQAAPVLQKAAAEFAKVFSSANKAAPTGGAAPKAATETTKSPADAAAGINVASTIKNMLTPVVESSKAANAEFVGFWKTQRGTQRNDNDIKEGMFSDIFDDGPIPVEIVADKTSARKALNYEAQTEQPHTNYGTTISNWGTGTFGGSFDYHDYATSPFADSSGKAFSNAEVAAKSLGTIGAAAAKLRNKIFLMRDAIMTSERNIGTFVDTSGGFAKVGTIVRNSLRPWELMRDGMAEITPKATLAQKAVARLTSALQHVVVTQFAWRIADGFKNAIAEIKSFYLELQDTYRNYSNFLNDSKQADALVATLQNFAVDTPFAFTELNASAKQLLTYGIKIESVMLGVRTAAEAASLSGDTQAIDRITRAFGQIYTKGRLMGEEMKQLTEVGVPAYEILREELHLTDEQVASIAKQGISAETALNALSIGIHKRYSNVLTDSQNTMRGVTNQLKEALVTLGTDILAPVYEMQRDMIGRIANNLRGMLKVSRGEIDKQFADFSISFDAPKINDEALWASGYVNHATEALRSAAANKRVVLPDNILDYEKNPNDLRHDVAKLLSGKVAGIKPIDIAVAVDAEETANPELPDWTQASAGMANFKSQLYGLNALMQRFIPPEVADNIRIFVQGLRTIGIMIANNIPALLRFGQALSAMWLRVAATTIPVVVAILDIITRLISWLLGGASAIAKISASLIGTVQIFMAAAGTLKILNLLFGNFVRTVVAGIGHIVTALTFLAAHPAIAVIVGFVALLASLTGVLSNFAKFVKQFTNEIGKLNGAGDTDFFKDYSTRAKAAMKEFSKAYKQGEKSAEDLADANKDLKKGLFSFDEVYKLDEAEKSLEDINTAFEMPEFEAKDVFNWDNLFGDMENDLVNNLADLFDPLKNVTFQDLIDSLTKLKELITSPWTIAAGLLAILPLLNKLAKWNKLPNGILRFLGVLSSAFAGFVFGFNAMELLLQALRELFGFEFEPEDEEVVKWAAGIITGIGTALMTAFENMTLPGLGLLLVGALIAALGVGAIWDGIEKGDYPELASGIDVFVGGLAVAMIGVLNKSETWSAVPSAIAAGIKGALVGATASAAVMELFGFDIGKEGNEFWKIGAEIAGFIISGVIGTLGKKSMWGLLLAAIAGALTSVLTEGMQDIYKGILTDDFNKVLTGVGEVIGGVIGLAAVSIIALKIKTNLAKKVKDALTPPGGTPAGTTGNGISGPSGYYNDPIYVHVVNQNSINGNKNLPSNQPTLSLPNGIPTLSLPKTTTSIPSLPGGLAAGAGAAGGGAVIGSKALTSTGNKVLQQAAAKASKEVIIDVYADAAGKYTSSAAGAALGKASTAFGKALGVVAKAVPVLNVVSTLAIASDALATRAGESNATISAENRNAALNAETAYNNKLLSTKLPTNLAVSADRTYNFAQQLQKAGSISKAQTYIDNMLGAVFNDAILRAADLVTKIQEYSASLATAGANRLSKSDISQLQHKKDEAQKQIQAIVDFYNILATNLEVSALKAYAGGKVRVSEEDKTFTNRVDKQQAAKVQQSAQAKASAAAIATQKAKTSSAKSQITSSTVRGSQNFSAGYMSEIQAPQLMTVKPRVPYTNNAVTAARQSMAQVNTQLANALTQPLKKATTPKTAIDTRAEVKAATAAVAPVSKALSPVAQALMETKDKITRTTKNAMGTSTVTMKGTSGALNGPLPDGWSGSLAPGASGYSYTPPAAGTMQGAMSTEGGYNTSSDPRIDTIVQYIASGNDALSTIINIVNKISNKSSTTTTKFDTASIKALASAVSNTATQNARAGR